jgi:hypothetical protein
MKDTQDLRETEKKVYRSVVDDGLWDVLLATFVSMWAIAPLLSPRLGDFWSSATIIPALAVVYMIVRFLRRRVVEPRVGVVRFGKERQARLRTFAVVMLVVNLVFFVAGLVAAVSPIPRGWSVTFGFAIVPLVLFSTAAYLLDFPRLYTYGLLLAAAALTGEWLFRGGYVRNHGIPVCLGAVAIVMALTGLIHFLAVARRKPPGAEDRSLEAQGV